MIYIFREAVKQSQIQFYSPKSVLEQIKTLEGDGISIKLRAVKAQCKKKFALKFDNQVNPKVA